jgi:CheY-like chemotaxis protein
MKPHGLSSTDSLTGLHILVVDDDEDARELLRTVLGYCGALVTAVSGASEGLTAIQRELPDAVVCDIAMPEHDGYWFLRALRALPRDKGGTVPVLAVTAHGYLHGPDRTLPAGFDGHIRKPVDPWELCRALAGVARRG